MHKLLLIFCFVSFYSCQSQKNTELQSQINQIISHKKALVGVHIIAPDGTESVNINAYKPFVLQSVFKFHIALKVLSEIDRGQLSLEQPIDLAPKDLLPNLWSPLREANPQGGRFTIAQLIHYAVAKSDNVACDVLIRLIGTPKDVDSYLRDNGFKDFAITLNEEKMQAQWENMFQNWMTPKTASQILQKFYHPKQKFLSPKSYDFIWETMKQTSTAPSRIKGLLPRKTQVAHKTGTSGTQNGITEATNDIGIVFLPNGKHFIISVFVSHSSENETTNDKIIAKIAKATYNFYINKN